MAKHEETGGSHARHEAPRAEEPKRRKKSGAAEERPARKRTAAPAAKPRKKAAAKRDYFDEESEVLRVREESPAPKKRSSKRRRRLKKRLRSAAILLGSILLAVVCGALYAGSCVSASETNLPNVYMDGIDVSGLTKEETKAKLQEQGWDRESQIPLRVQLPAAASFEIDRLKAGAVMSLNEAVESIYRYGHSGNWVGDLSTYLSARMHPVSLGEFTAHLDEAYIDRCVKEGLATFASMTGGSDEYYVNKETETLDIVKGAGHLELDGAKLTAAVREALLAGEESMRYDTLENPPQIPDFPSIFQELQAEPQDAHFVEGGWDVVDEVVGCNFDVHEAETLWTAANWMETVQIPLEIRYPEVTGESLRALLFRDMLGTETTYFPNSIKNRVSNINLAASKLDGIILYPGDELSYNQTIGQRTEEAGFLPAGAYADGEVVEEIGGGICQVSSTLYCAVVRSNLEIVQRSNHYFRVEYLPIGFDATVSWPGPDFVFRNNRDYPIKIVTYCDTVERYIGVQIWGTNVDGTYVEMSNNGVWTIYDTEYPGTAIGTATTTYREIYSADGTLLETVQENYSDYHKHPEDIQWPPEKLAADAAKAAEAAG